MLNKKTLFALCLIIAGGFGVGFFIYKDLTDDKGSDASLVPEGTFPDLARVVIGGGIDSEQSAEITERLLKLAENIRENPDLQHNWLELGNLRKDAQDFEGAEEIWKYIIEKWSNERVGYENLGVLYHFYIRDYERAEEYLLLAIDKDPNWANNYINLHELYRYSYAKKADLADDALLQGLEQLPKHVALLFTLASYYMEDGDADSARMYFEQVLEASRLAGDIATEDRVTKILGELKGN